jgi:hypothetical protein
MVKPPYGIIWTGLAEGSVVPFLGSGASVIGRPAQQSWDPVTASFLPSGVELAHYLANETEYPSNDVYDRNDLAKVSSYFEDVGGRVKLRKTLHAVFSKSYQFGPLHQFLASVPSHLVIVSTNYDIMLEQAFQAAGKPYDLVVYPADRDDLGNAVLWWQHGAPEPKVEAPNELDIDLKKTTVIFKMHGTVSEDVNYLDNYVITEEDYVEFLSRMTTNSAIPSLFINYFMQKSFLFLGYSLRDWNLRVVLKNLNKYFARRTAQNNADEVPPSWAIQLSPSELESTLWQKRNVAIYGLSLDEFVKDISIRCGNPK